MKYFGTDGFRGEANITLTVEHAFKIGRFLGAYYREQRGESARIVIGKDTRRSSYMFENALAAGITASGSDAYLLHVTTTPSVSYVVSREDFDCGIMISASHNPFYDNGIKLINHEGIKMEEEVLEKVEAYLDGESGEIPLATGKEIGRTIDYFLGRNRYIAYLISTVSHSFKGIKVGLDCANGAAFMIAKSVFDALGAETHVIHNHPDGFNINVNCGSTHIESLQQLVRDENLDVGFAYDGDADRCLVVDNNGLVVSGDGILYIYAKYLKDKNKLVNNTVVTTVMSNLGLYKAFDALGIDYVKTPVGDKYVAQNMAETGNCLGGEQSGHIIFGKYASTGDGILTSLRMMEVMLKAKTDFATLHRDLKIYPQVLENIRVVEKQSVLENEAVQAEAKAVEEWLGNDGRLLIRPSGTEPLFRVMAEASSPAICREAVERILRVIRSENLHEK